MVLEIRDFSAKQHRIGEGGERPTFHWGNGYLFYTSSNARGKKVYRIRVTIEEDRITVDLDEN